MSRMKHSFTEIAHQVTRRAAGDRGDEKPGDGQSPQQHTEAHSGVLQRHLSSSAGIGSGMVFFRVVMSRHSP